MRRAGNLNLILETRLDVLAQAVAEVKSVIEAVTSEAERLKQVEDFLSLSGVAHDAKRNMEQHVRDIQNRVDRLLERQSTTSAAASRTGWTSQLPPLSEDDLQRLYDIRQFVNEALTELAELGKGREEADRLFGGVRRWSVAGLGDLKLRDAVRDYETFISDIRSASRPWLQYLQETPRGQQMFSRYLELLTSMAVRGFDPDPAAEADARALIDLLKGPEVGTPEPARSPLPLMSVLGLGQTPLGYPKWSLWALPLLGRTAGRLVVTSLLGKAKDSRLQVICEDLYAQYVLGPSYLYAAVFLEFDPRPNAPRPGLPPDPLRARVLLRDLRDSVAGDRTREQRIAEIIAPVEREWQHARAESVPRAASGGQERDLDAGDRKKVDDFLKNLREQYPEIPPYPVDELLDLPDVATALLEPDPGEDKGRIPGIQLRSLMSAMWVARLRDPSKAQFIYERAMTVPRQATGPNPGQGGLGAQPRSRPWA